jgi:hypothetical protein
MKDLIKNNKIKYCEGEKNRITIRNLNRKLYIKKHSELKHQSNYRKRK